MAEGGDGDGGTGIRVAGTKEVHTVQEVVMGEDIPSGGEREPVQVPSINVRSPPETPVATRASPATVAPETPVTPSPESPSRSR